MEFCDDLFPSIGDAATAVTENGRDSASGTPLKTPKRKSSAPRSTAGTNKATAGDLVSENGQLQQLRSNNEPSTPSSSPSSGQNGANGEEESPKRQQLERVDAVLALRGVTLREAVQGIVEKRQLNMERVNLFLESSNTPLPWETDTSFLGGHKLYAKGECLLHAFTNGVTAENSSVFVFSRRKPLRGVLGIKEVFGWANLCSCRHDY